MINRIEILNQSTVIAMIENYPPMKLPKPEELFTTFTGIRIVAVYPSRLNDMDVIDINLAFAREIKPNKYLLR